MINLQKHKMGRELRIRVKTVVKILVMVLRLQPMPGDLDPFHVSSTLGPARSRDGLSVEKCHCFSQHLVTQ